MPNLRRQLLFRLATSERFEWFVRRLPLGQRRAYRAARRYVAGATRDHAFAVARRLDERGIASSLDYFGESVSDRSGAAAATAEYVDLAVALSVLDGVDAYLSIDLSHVGLDISEAFCRTQVERIAEALPSRAWLQIGAEESARTDRIMAVSQAVARSGGRVMATLQANLRRSEADASALAEAGIPVRLVKGAYVEPPHLAHRWGEETNSAYRRLAHQLHAARADVALATHDRPLRDALFADLGRVPVEMLLGVRSDDAAKLVAGGHHVRLYVPFGEAWFRYWMRRVAESQGA